MKRTDCKHLVDIIVGQTQNNRSGISSYCSFGEPMSYRFSCENCKHYEKGKRQIVINCLCARGSVKNISQYNNIEATKHKLFRAEYPILSRIPIVRKIAYRYFENKRIKINFLREEMRK